MKKIAFAGILFFSVLLLVEFVLRYNPALFANEIDKNFLLSIKRKALVQKVQARIYRNWSENFTSPFKQPWVVFENVQFNDDQRIEKIWKHSKFEPNQKLVVENVFRDPLHLADSQFTVQTNSMGFRDLERSKTKPKNTFRIFVLGTYTTFGYGVNDEQTYVRLLEKKLNANPANKIKFEVWNLGRHGSTIISAYSFLKKEILDYSPDLILLDYGWPDVYTSSDSASESFDGQIKKYFQKGSLKFFLDICYLNSVTQIFFDSTEICQRLTTNLSNNRYAENVKKFEDGLD